MLGVDCANFNVFCDQWASAGQCETNASYMDIYCAKACQRCTTSSRKVTQYSQYSQYYTWLDILGGSDTHPSRLEIQTRTALKKK